jgi:hypothetical protein
MITRRRALRLIGFGGAVAAGTGRRGHAAELDEVKIGTPLVISDAPIVIAEAKGYCREQGIRTTLINLVTGSQMVAPLGAGQIDVAAAATSAGLFQRRCPRHRAQDRRRQGLQPAGLRLCVADRAQGAGRFREIQNPLGPERIAGCRAGQGRFDRLDRQ